MMSGVPKLRLLSLILAVLCAVAAALPVPALHAAFGFVSRGGEVTYLGKMDTEEVDGVRVHLLSEDGSRTYATTHWHEYRLYIIEATALPSAPPPNSFPVSIGFIDEEGRRVRYEERYAPLFPTPARDR